MLDQAKALEGLLVDAATGTVRKESEYQALRQSVISSSLLKPHLPRFLKTCGTLSHFWQFIKSEYSTYKERRTFLWGAFRPMLDALECTASSPSDTGVSAALAIFDSIHVQATWSKALERRTADPGGAITAARTLLESVCKHILDEADLQYGEAPDLNKLYRLTAEQLKIAPSQHTEPVFKQILGGCTAVVEGLGSLRNRLSDSHGQGKGGAKPSPRHAELAVNLAGTLATFLIATWEARKE